MKKMLIAGVLVCVVLIGLYAAGVGASPKEPSGSPTELCSPHGGVREQNITYTGPTAPYGQIDCVDGTVFWLANGHITTGGSA